MRNYIMYDSEDEIEKPLYRIFSIERLLEIFSKNTLVLVKPKKWDDPFENFILKSKASFENGEIATIAFANSIFGQCWSLHRENDAMWRIYSPTKNGVKIKTTSKKLREALAAEVRNPDVSAFIGKVQYKTQSNLSEMVQDRVRMQNKIFDTSGRGHAETLLFKRKEFSHEKEVRLIYSGTDQEAIKDTFSFHVDPFLLIDEIVFDPRMDEKLASIYTRHFKDFGFSGAIKRSTLYELPNLQVNVQQIRGDQSKTRRRFFDCSF